MFASSRLPRNIYRIIYFLCFVLGSQVASTQATYNMTNAYVTDCEGILLDSEEGPEEGQYNHNEDFIFTICIDGAEEIILTFQNFATEVTYDILTAYDGPDTNSPVIAVLTGVLQPAPVIIATSGCLTLHFISDDNIVASGWIAEWTVDIVEPVPPILSIESDIECPLESAIFSFDYPIDCSNFDPANFSIAGPGNNTISAINVLDCDPQTNLGQQFEVFFDGPLSQEGSYRLIYEISIQDACGEWHDISANILFDLTNCPFDVYIEALSYACEGDCGVLYANIVGGNMNTTYDFAWSHTPLNQQQVNVCTEDPILISVTVTDQSTMQMVTADFLYTPLENPEFNNPLDHDTFCASNSNHWYSVTLGGGEFYSRVIPDGERTSGKYQFWRWSNAPGLEQDIVTYYAPNGCQVQDTFYILPINAGSIQAACEGGPPFTVNGGTPVGGYWTGPNIDSFGVFDPVQDGSFWVTYNAPNGCTRNKRINVAPEIIMPDIDTICSSQRIFLEAIPYGGRWSGPAIMNSVNGRLDPWRVTPNQTYRYYYDLNGCRDSMDIYIQELWSGPDYTICSEQDFIVMNQAGDWSGPGIYNAADSSFDVSGLSNGYYDFTISLGACSDRFELRIATPRIDEYYPLYFCLEDNWHNIYNYIGTNLGGTFSGASIVESNGDWYFNPSLVGPGSHMLYFNALGCQDSILIEVEAPSVIPSYSFCELNPIIQLNATPPGGTWDGSGFIDPQSGLYDPQLVGTGIFDIWYYAPSGCVTQASVEVFAFEEVSISGLDQQYCYGDTIINVNLQPAGGEFYINGVLATPQINPITLGEGNHEILYTKGLGACESTEREFITIMPPITGLVDASNDSICVGDNAVISIQTQGGVSNLSSTWDQGLGFGSSHIVRPDQSTWYHVEVNDGCSAPYFDSLYVHVYPEFNINMVTGPEVCFEDSTFVMIETSDPNNYSVMWLTDPPLVSDILEDRPGYYTIEVTELSSGCIQEYEIQLPGATPLKANFTLNPNQACIDIIENEIEIIDLATGYSEGWIDFGDGSPLVPMGQGIIVHEYQGIGDFIITQYISNDIGCTDTLSVTLCIENKIEFYIPNAFSPNGDEVNDILMINAFGVTDVNWATYDRWGTKLFEAESLDVGWDGMYKGKVLQPGVYVLKFDFTDLETGVRQVHWSTVTIFN